MSADMRTIRLGQIGCGTVGSGVISILQDNREVIAKRTGCEIQVLKVAVGSLSDPRFVEVPEEILTTDAWRQ
jgi:homoserine dehydrogenase